MQNAVVQLSPKAQEILRSLETVPQRILSAIAAAHDRQNQYTLAHITKDYMSFSRSGPAMPIGTRVQTNRLRGSMRASQAVIEGQVVTSGIGSNVEYAGPMEFGSAPHRINAPPGGVLRFYAAGKPVFCKWVNHPGTKERAFTRRGIADRIDNYGTAISRGVVKAFNNQSGGAN